MLSKFWFTNVNLIFIHINDSQKSGISVSVRFPFSIKLTVKQDNISNIRIIPEKDSDKKQI